MTETLSEAFACWARVSNRSEFTIETYSKGLRSLARFGVVRPEDAQRETVASFVQFRRLFVEPVTVNTELAALATVLGFLRQTAATAESERFRLLRNNVRDQMIRLKRPRRLSAPHLSPTEVRQLAQAARIYEPQLELPILVDAYAGLRIRELVRLRWCELDLGTRPSLAVRLCPELGREGRIKGGSERRVPVCAELRGLLLSRRAELGRDFLFLPRLDALGKNNGRRFASPHTYRIALSRVVARAGLGRRVTWTIFRHTRASWWVQAGVPIAKVALWLGHTVEICERYYAGLIEGYDEDCERMPAA